MSSNGVPPKARGFSGRTALTTVAITIVVLGILGVALVNSGGNSPSSAGRIESDTGISNHSEPKWPVPERAAFTAYTDNTDGDVEEEIVTYFELFGPFGEETACDCNVSIERLYDGGDVGASWSTKSWTYGFEHATVGRGGFARQAFIYSVTLQVGQENQRSFCGKSIDLRLTITTKEGIVLQDKDSVYYSC